MDPNLIYSILAVIISIQLIAISYYMFRQKKTIHRIGGLSKSLRKSEDFIKNLQTNAKQTKQKEEELSTIFVFLPELISKLSSYNERRDIFDITIKWIQKLLKPQRSYIFIEKDGQWVVAVKRDKESPTEDPKCKKTEGVLGVACELKMTIEKENLGILGIEKREALRKDPLDYLQFQVVAPIVYNDEVHGVIGLSGIPLYSRQKMVLVNMVSDLVASSLVNSMLFSRFKHMASRDPLTNLVNKRGFENAMLDAVLKASREKRDFSVFIFDIDFFKNYNDTNGHQAGDEALRITAKLLQENFRSGDIKARYGGEEFIVLMNETSKQQAHELAERFRSKVQQFPYPHEKNQPGGFLTVSGGIAAFPVDGGNIKEIVEKADEALYRAKQGGRNKVLLAQSIDFDFSDETGQSG